MGSRRITPRTKNNRRPSGAVFNYTMDNGPPLVYNKANRGERDKREQIAAGCDFFVNKREIAAGRGNLGNLPPKFYSPDSPPIKTRLERRRNLGNLPYLPYLPHEKEEKTIYIKIYLLQILKFGGKWGKWGKFLGFLGVVAGEFCGRFGGK